MKLKLNHLAPYLPFELKALVGNIQKDVILHQNYNNNYQIWFLILLSDADKVAKPILRPLNNIKNPITHNGKTFIPLHELLKNNCFNLEKMTEERINEFEATFIDAYSWSYKDAITLCSWHYDIFNLIEKGLAIDINSLPLADA